MKYNPAPTTREINFILQQGLDKPDSQSRLQYSALLFQPRLVGLTLLIGILFQSPAVFLALTTILWWNALLPRWNPFDAVYNAIVGSKPDAIRLSPAPSPRRFAQGLAGLFALVIAVSLILGLRVLAYVFEALFIVAAGALIFGGFCLGSFIYHFLVGRGEFARHTLPWSGR